MSDLFRLSPQLDVSRRDASNDLVSFDLLATASLDLPALSATVDQFGASVVVSLVLDRSGSFGFFDCAIVAHPPVGMSAELQLPPVSGGGYLAKVGDELRGAFAANLGVLNVSALAVIGTREFSMLVLMAAEFTPPLQLSFGFTLVGVGGLVGINRRADSDALTASLTTGELSRLLFPRDPIAEAPRILEVASRCFPRQDGSVLVGPMIKIGWGTPTMMSATLAVIVSPTDGHTIILGRLAVTLPFEQLPLINLEVIVKGEVDQNGVRIDGSLVNSRIIFVPVDGDLRLRLIASPRPVFALSAGGFFPGYPVPEGMEGMRRLSTTLPFSPLLQLRLEAYAAITAASVQMGARVEVQAGIDGFGIHGFGQFDAFVSIDPLGFETRLAASVSVECADFDVASIHLEGRVGGPAPWRFRGNAAFEVLFWEIEIGIPEIKWGPEPHASIPARDPLDVLGQAVKRPENWIAAASDVPHLVMLRAGAGAETAIHPLGVVGVRQRSIPLNTEIERVDGARLGVPVTLQVTTDAANTQIVPVNDSFVPAQFFQLDDNARLVESGYRELPGGFNISAGGTAPPPSAVRHCDHEVKELHEDFRWHGARVRLDALGLLEGRRTRRSVEPDALVIERSPAVRVAVRASDFTDAAGRRMSAVPGWEIT